MASELPTLRSLLSFTLDGEWGFDADAPAPVKTTSMRVIRGTDFDSVQAGSINSVPIRAIRADIAQRKVLEPGDVLIETAGGSAKRSTGRVCFVSEGLLQSADNPVTCASFARILRFDKAKVDPEFAYWYLQNLYATGVMAEHQVQHTGISRFQFTRFAAVQTMMLPSHGEQQSIVATLSVIENRIRTLKFQNETLERIARAIFKSWFVDFDPVRAKAEGQEPEGMDAVTAALFPDSFEDSSVDRIPKGWTATTLGNEAASHGGRIQTGPFGSQLHASDYVSDGVPVVMPQNILNRRVETDRIARIRESDAERLSRHRVEVGDIIYSRRGDVEKHAQVGTAEVGWLCGTGCLLARMGPQWPSASFVSLALDRPESRAWIAQHAIGATMPNLNVGILANVPLVLPNYAVLHAFEQIAAPMEQAISTNRLKSVTLQEIRDTLLPRLISGKLRISEAEKMAEAAL